MILWISYFITLIAVVEMMPRQFSRFTGFLGSKVNYIMWWCFLKGMWKAVRGASHHPPALFAMVICV